MQGFSRGIFIAGTDTGVGKTVVACAVLRAAVSAGWRAVGMKPVASGVAAGECGEDVVALAAAGNIDAPLAALCVGVPLPRSTFPMYRPA